MLRMLFKNVWSQTFAFRDGANIFSFSNISISSMTGFIWSSAKTSNMASSASAWTQSSVSWQATSNSNVPMGCKKNQQNFQHFIIFIDVGVFVSLYFKANSKDLVALWLFHLWFKNLEPVHHCIKSFVLYWEMTYWSKIFSYIPWAVCVVEAVLTKHSQLSTQCVQHWPALQPPGTDDPARTQTQYHFHWPHSTVKIKYWKLYTCICTSTLHYNEFMNFQHYIHTHTYI